MTVKSSISLTDQQAAFARSLVREGRYASLSSVVQQGLDLLRQKTEAEVLEAEALRLLIAQRREGDFISGNEMKQRLSARLTKKRRVHGLEG
ncbi:type II toxin-antitoxin system ParD family antitoxin [Kiloniella laminariae]|uniref:Type II toxin-antitoxin system ParD family antitoxin n=1 Tax=Kiloniella laminariae TaxID=454162 RepID=A0ABT4LJ39_9PROT|nr:type II toxin-antitoxin system ParD family antitoxin [Kiloniella laminariae]MCZ4281120.1 type II toxin-antitoxin system ParD family antitoxin [Kiloniella laminariae]